MKPILSTLRSERATGASGNTDSLGRGMDTALTLVVFLGIGALIDRWLGVVPVFTIALFLLAAVGTFVRMKFVYDAAMERHEAELRASRGARSTTMEDAT